MRAPLNFLITPLQAPRRGDSLSLSLSRGVFLSKRRRIGLSRASIASASCLPFFLYARFFFCSPLVYKRARLCKFWRERIIICRLKHDFDKLIALSARARARSRDLPHSWSRYTRPFLSTTPHNDARDVVLYILFVFPSYILFLVCFEHRLVYKRLAVTRERDR